jgi:hypothetical protein
MEQQQEETQFEETPYRETQEEKIENTQEWQHHQ